MPVNKNIPTLDQFVAHYGGLESLSSQYDLNQGEREKLLDSLKSKHEEFSRKFSKFPIILYREISLTGGLDTLNQGNMGMYWTTFNMEKGRFWGGPAGEWLGAQPLEGTSWIFKALAMADDINWYETMWSRFYPYLGEQEQEITLKEGARIRVVAARKASGKEWRPFEKTVTASAEKAPGRREGPARWVLTAAGPEIAEQETELEPWTKSEEEYAPRPKYLQNEKGDWYTEETDEQAMERYRRKHVWEQDSLSALSFGKMTVEQAKEKGLYVGGFTRGFQPLPQTLYHVTTHLNEVQQHGLKTRFELGMQSGHGLGGGTEMAISFTEDIETAKGIYSAIIEAIRVLNGTLTVGQMMEMAYKGTGAQHPWIVNAVRWGGAHFVSNEWNPGEPYPALFQAFIEGKKVVHPPGFGALDDEMPLAEPIGEGWEGADGRKRHSAFKVMMDEDEKRKMAFDWFKTWLATREEAGGPLNPLFFSTDTDALARIPESEVAILQFEPIPGAMGTQESALGEWRTYTGKAVKLIGIVRAGNMPTAKAAATPAVAPIPYQPSMRILEPTETPQFRQWFRNSVVKDGDGAPIPVYHGSTHDFEKFNPSLGHTESHFGPGIYFTDSQEDVSRNYATPESPDLKRRIEMRAEEIMREIEDRENEGMSYSYHTQEYREAEERSYERARKEIMGSTGGMVYVTYLRIERPVVIKKGGGTRFYINFNERTGQETGSGVRLWKKVIEAGNRLGCEGDKIWGEAIMNLDSSDFTVYEFDHAVRESDAMMEGADRNPELNTGIFLSFVYQLMGFDGIVQEDADQAFPGMGMEPDTTHYVVWNPRQVKSAIGNVGKFSPWSPRMTADLKSPLLQPIGKEAALEYLGPKDYKYRTSCVERGVSNDINDMVDAAEEVKYNEVKKHCDGLFEWEGMMGYAPDGSRNRLTLRKDWSVSYHRSMFKGMPCYYIQHSAIEYVWTRKGYDIPEPEGQDEGLEVTAAKTAAKVSETQREILEAMVAGDGNIWRVKGGFWVMKEPTGYNPTGAPILAEGQPWCDVRTVRALEKAGLLMRANTFPEEWRDTRRITDAGRAMLETGSGQEKQTDTVPKSARTERKPPEGQEMLPFPGNGLTAVSYNPPPSKEAGSYDGYLPDRHSDFFEPVENPHSDREEEVAIDIAKDASEKTAAWSGLAYHGTMYGAPEVFQTEPEDIKRKSGYDINALLGAHFSAVKNVAKEFAGGLYQITKKGEDPVVLTVRLTFRNPLRVSEDGLQDYINEIREYLDELAGVGMGQEWGVKDHVQIAREVKDVMMAEGYDSIIYDNEVEGGIAYVAFHPEQIRVLKMEKAGGEPVQPSPMGKAALGKAAYSDEAMYAGVDARDAVAMEILDEYKRVVGDGIDWSIPGKPVTKKHLRQKNYHQRWEVVPAARLKKIWIDYAKTGMVTDEAGMDGIAGIVAGNVHKISVNTILCGHTQYNPEEWASEMLDEEVPDGYFDLLPNFFDDSDSTTWRISDFAMGSLEDLAIQLYEPHTAEEKLQIVDRILNTVHQRGDIASWFIQGGKATLDALFKYRGPEFKLSAAVKATSIPYDFFKISPSPLHGNGVFAECDVPKGYHLTLFPSGERFIRNEDIPAGQQPTYDWFGVKDKAKGGYWIPFDMENKDKGWYLNHSNSPNAVNVNGGEFYAVRDIRKGEEVLIDYASLGPGNLTKEAKTAAERGIWYHGSSIKNLRSIIAQGLIPDPGERNWADDPEARVYSPSRASYGGIYVTRNLMTAASSPRDHNTEGREVVVCMELQPSTFYLDEDDIKFYIEKPLKNASDVSGHVLAAYLASTLPNNSGWKESADQERDAYIESAVKNLKYKYHGSDTRQKDSMHPGMEERLRELLPGAWLAALSRLAAQHASKEGDWSKWDSQKAYMEVFPGTEWDKIPPKETLFPTIEQGEAGFMREAEKITRALRLYARPGSRATDRETARVVDPIGYSGSNRILAVVEVMDGRKYRGDNWKKPARIVIHYGRIPADFFAQYRERYGNEYLVENARVAGEPFSGPGLDEQQEKAEVPASQAAGPGQHPLAEPWMTGEEEMQAGKAASSKTAFPRNQKIPSELADWLLANSDS